MRLRSSPVAWLLLGFHYPFCTMNGVAAEIEPIVVTATRGARSTDETLAAVTVITRQDIECRQARSVEELLRGTPGLSISNNGGAGKATSVFLRGTESDHVLVLIDGVKIGSATLGSAAFQDLPVELIERIEIVRGPRSSLYGSEAIGGVIQILTRKGGDGFKPFAAVGGGRYRSYNAAAGVSDGTARGWYSLSVEGVGTDGFNACDGKPSPGGAGCFTVESDRDGYRRRAAALRGDYRFENGVAVDAQLLHAEGDNAFDGGFVSQSESVQQVFGGTLRYAPADIWQMTLAAGQSRDQSDNFKDGARIPIISFRRAGIG